MKFSSLNVLFIPFLNVISFISASEIREVLGTRPPRPHFTPGITQPNLSGTHHSTVQYHSSCNLTAPSKSDWDAGESHSVKAWLKNEWKKFYYEQGDILDFPTYMRVNFAPDLAPSAFKCQALGSCSIGDCQNIRTDLPLYDRQMAYWVFESIANIDLTAKTMKDVIDDVTQSIYGRSSEEISLFTWRDEAHAYELEKKHQRELDMQIATFVLLVLSAIVGVVAAALPVVGVAASTVAIANLGSSVVTMVSSAYIGTAGLVKQLDATDSNYMSNVQNRFESAWQKIATNAEFAIKDDLEAYWTGYRGKETWDQAADQMIASGSFVEFNPNFYKNVKDLTAKWFTAVSIGMLWGLENIYILDTDTEWRKDCESDSNGPPRNKVCLPERPGRTFWLYGIEPRGSVASPPGLRTILDNPDRFYGITKEDIVRSSLWVHEQDIRRKDIGWDAGVSPADIVKQLPGLKEAGEVPGAFAVPICRNPSGEAISSVWSEKDKHYPCRCGEIETWTNKAFRNVGRHESQQFYIESGLYASDDFEWHCQHKSKCKGMDHEYWQWDLPEGSAPHAKALKHPWEVCKNSGVHFNNGFPDKDT